MRYSLAITGDPALVRLTALAAAPLGLELRDSPAQFSTSVERHEFPAEDGHAVVVVRSSSGQVVSYPPIQCRPSRGGIETVAPAPGIDAEAAVELQGNAIRVAVERELVGAMTVVCIDGASHEFVGPDQTGFWSIDAAQTSVFQNHVRAVLGLPLGSPEPLTPVAVTVTAAVGSEEDPTGALQHIHARDRHGRVHLYGLEAEPGAPLGHVTCFGHDLADLLRRAHHAANYLMGVDDR